MDSRVLRGCLTPIFIYGAFTLIISARSVSACGDNWKDGVGSRTIQVSKLLTDIEERLLPDNYCNSVHGDQSVVYGLLNFHGAKVTVECNPSHRHFTAKVRDCRHPEGEPIETLIGTGNIMPDLPLDTEIEIYSLEGKEPPPYVENISTLTYLGGHRFFEPLKERLDAISALFDEYCKSYASTTTQSLHIVIDTVILTPVFRCNSGVVTLSPDVSTGSTKNNHAFFDDDEPLSLQYDRKEGTYKSKNSGIDGSEWTLTKCKETWRVISFVDGSENPNKTNKKVRGTSLRNIGFYLRLLKFDLELLSLAKIAGDSSDPETYGSIRIGETSILTAKYLGKKVQIETKYACNDELLKLNGVIFGESKNVYFCNPHFRNQTNEINPMSIFLPEVQSSIPKEQYVVQYIEIEAIEWALKEAAKQIPHNDKIIPVNIVYREKFMLATRFYSAKNGRVAFGIDGLTIYRELPQVNNNFVILNRLTYQFVCFLLWMDNGVFTLKPGLFNEPVAVYLEPVKNDPNNFKTTELKKGVWHMETPVEKTQLLD